MAKGTSGKGRQTGVPQPGGRTSGPPAGGRHRVLNPKAPAMMHSLDREGRIIDITDRWLETLGYERDEVLGRKSTEFLTEESRRFAEEEALPAFWKSGSAEDIPFQFVKKCGEVIDVLLSAIAEQDERGATVRTHAFLTDVTELRRAEEALNLQSEILQDITEAVYLKKARERLEGRVERQMRRRNPYSLTFRELTVLHQVADGLADKEIAAQLGISPLTIHKHVANILAKMEASSRTEAGVRAQREGLLD